MIFRYCSSAAPSSARARSITNGTCFGSIRSFLCSLKSQNVVSTLKNLIIVSKPPLVKHPSQSNPREPRLGSPERGAFSGRPMVAPTFTTGTAIDPWGGHCPPAGADEYPQGAGRICNAPSSRTAALGIGPYKVYRRFSDFHTPQVQSKALVDKGVRGNHPKGFPGLFFCQAFSFGEAKEMPSVSLPGKSKQKKRMWDTKPARNF